ncbi:hypothetical protein GC194_01545 [bacterium]|nr:hypothetical protein [bacterium]
MSKEFNCSKTELWERITNVDLFPQMKDEVHRVEMIDPDGTKWIEYSKVGTQTVMEIIEKVDGEKLVLKITDPELNIEKKRVYTLFGNDENSVLSIKEFTRVEKLLLRSTLAISGNKQGIKKELYNLEQYVSL